MLDQSGPYIGLRVTPTDHILYAPDFLATANNLLLLISEIDAAFSEQFLHTVDWSIKLLSYQKSAELVLEAIAREGIPDNKTAIIKTVIEGLSSLNKNDIRPRYFSDRALSSACNLVSVLGERIARIEIFSDSTNVTCTVSIATNVRKIMQPETVFAKASDISGIFDITKGLDAEEYIRRMRDA